MRVEWSPENIEVHLDRVQWTGIPSHGNATQMRTHYGAVSSQDPELSPHLCRMSRRMRKTLGNHRLLRCLLVAMLALWLGLLPSLPLLHLAFAGHAHLYCAEHHRIEDVPRRSCHCADKSGERSRSERGWLNNNPTKGDFCHSPCSTVNNTAGHIAGLALTSHLLPTLALQLRALSLKPAVHRPTLHSSSLLLTAPMTSPPHSCVARS